ncbi:MAG: ROK family protein, partial [Planctomycetota bacterium]
VFGGGLIGAGDLLMASVQRHFDELTWRFEGDRPKLAAATLGGDAGVIGAAALARVELCGGMPDTRGERPADESS